MKFEKKSLHILEKALDRLEAGFAALPDVESDIDYERLEQMVLETADRLHDNYPYFHPLYAGQMLKPPHPVARLAYMLALWINPNNHALDGGRASSAMEKKAVAEIARLFGWEECLGHLTGGGTMANMEALWVAGKAKPGTMVVASDQAHYTHRRLSDVLSLEFRAVPCNQQAQMDIEALKRLLDVGPVGTVVATVGTTGAGAVDPLPELLELKRQFGFRIHADAAYGGYFTLADNLDASVRRAFDCLCDADSIVVDPHKHGLQPYGCGCILFRDPAVGRFYKHDSPYTYFSSAELHLGEISLECSRAGAAAVALWATQHYFPMVKGGDFSRGLSQCVDAAQAFYGKIAADNRFRTILKPELDIVVWAPNGKSAAEVSNRSERIFNAAAQASLHLATFRFPSDVLKKIWNDVEFDQKDVVCLRSCLMKPEHLEWIDQLWEILDRITDEQIE